MNRYAIFFALASAALAACTASKEVVEAPLVVEVRTAKAKVQDIEEVVRAPATVFPITEAKVAPKVAAPIARVGVRKGDRVSKGQALAWLRSEDLQAQLSDFQAQVTDAEASLEKASGGTLPAEIQRAQGEVERTEAALAEAKQIFDRRKVLVAEGALPERDLLLAKTQFEQAQTASRVAASAVELLSNGSQRQDLRIAQSRLAQAKARLKLAEVHLGYTRIDSPSQGVVTEQFLYPGDMARPDAPIFTVMDLSVAVARGQAPEEKTGGLHAGQPCRFSGVTGAETERSGKITVVSQTVDPLRRTVEIWCEIPNPDSAIKAGAFGELTVVVGVHPAAVTVPTAAVELEPDRRSGVVWTVGADGVAHENRVRTGVASPDAIEIESGVNEGDSVVIEGGYGLSDGIAVQEAQPSG